MAILIIPEITIGPLQRATKRRAHEWRRKQKEEEVHRRRLLKMSSTTLSSNLPCLPHDSIQINPHFSTHFFQPRKDPIFLFHFFNAGYQSSSHMDYQYFFYLNKKDALMINRKEENGGVKLRTLISIPNYNIHAAPVGCCNGLVCLYLVHDERRFIEIYNPTRREKLGIISPIIDAIKSIQAYGFGLDLITKEYKVVCISEELENCCLVYTLGINNSWRKVTGPCPCILMSATNHHYRAAVISCDGTLYWRTDNPFKMLLFNLHDEKFQFIEIPSGRFTFLPISFRVMEYKGCLCFATVEGIDESPNCKVNLLILKDKQVWIEETLLVPFPCTRNARMVCFTDQVLLYWFCGKQFLFYNVHTKVSNAVHFPSCFSDEKYLDAFHRSFNKFGYRLYCHVPNPLCLETFSEKSVST